MVSKNSCRQEGYQKGLLDGRRTGGKVRKSYIDKFFKDETQNLSLKDSSEFVKGLQEGFDDGVREVINNLVVKEGLIEKVFISLINKKYLNFIKIYIATRNCISPRGSM